MTSTEQRFDLRYKLEFRAKLNLKPTVGTSELVEKKDLELLTTQARLVIFYIMIIKEDSKFNTNTILDFEMTI